MQDLDRHGNDPDLQNKQVFYIIIPIKKFNTTAYLDAFLVEILGDELGDGIGGGRGQLRGFDYHTVASGQRTCMMKQGLIITQLPSASAPA